MIDETAQEGKKKISMEVVMERMKELPVSLWKTLYQVGRDDPRRVIHALKVGTALTLVSLLYLLEPLFEGVGQNAMWAVMTVVVVFEFTAGIYIHLYSCFCTHIEVFDWCC